MAFPVGAIGGSLAAICGSMGRRRRDLSSVDTMNFRDLKTLKTLSENKNKILNYLKESFEAEIFFEEELEIDATIYMLKFEDINIGIRLDNTMIINNGIENSCRYAYNLVWGELVKIKVRDFE